MKFHHWLTLSVPLKMRVSGTTLVSVSVGIVCGSLGSVGHLQSWVICELLDPLWFQMQKHLCRDHTAELPGGSLVCWKAHRAWGEMDMAWMMFNTCWLTLGAPFLCSFGQCSSLVNKSRWWSQQGNLENRDLLSLPVLTRDLCSLSRLVFCHY